MATTWSGPLRSGNPPCHPGLASRHPSGWHPLLPPPFLTLVFVLTLPRLCAASSPPSLTGSSASAWRPISVRHLPGFWLLRFPGVLLERGPLVSSCLALLSVRPGGARNCWPDGSARPVGCCSHRPLAASKNFMELSACSVLAPFGPKSFTPVARCVGCGASLQASAALASMRSSRPPQKSLSLKIERRSRFHSQTGTSPGQAVPLRPARPPGPSAWLTTSASLDTRVPAPLLKVALRRRRLRMPVWDGDSACGMCGEVNDKWGYHALSLCGGDKVFRDNAVRNVVCSSVAEFTSVTPKLEKPGLLLRPRPPDPGELCPNSIRALTPADVWVPLGVSSFVEAWDFSVSSLLRTSHISSAAPSVADVFAAVEDRKRAFDDAASQVAAVGATSSSLVLEACGRRVVRRHPGSCRLHLS